MPRAAKSVTTFDAKTLRQMRAADVVLTRIKHWRSDRNEEYLLLDRARIGEASPEIRRAP